MANLSDPKWCREVLRLLESKGDLHKGTQFYRAVKKAVERHDREERK